METLRARQVDLVKRLASHQAVKDSESAAPQRHGGIPILAIEAARYLILFKVYLLIVSTSFLFLVVRPLLLVAMHLFLGFALGSREHPKPWRIASSRSEPRATSVRRSRQIRSEELCEGASK